MTGQLIFIRHSIPAFKGTNAHNWHLSDEGRAKCLPLAEKLRPYGIGVMVTSDEPKAIETGELIAEQLGLSITQAPNLNEQLRQTSPWFANEEERIAAITQLFLHPDAVVYGEESATAAYTRFAESVDMLVAQNPDQVLAIVTHGTVMTLYLERRAGIEALPFWKTMGIPMAVVLEPLTDGNYQVVASLE